MRDIVKGKAPGADDAFYMQEALKEAGKAAEKGEIPIGAVVVRGGQIIGRGHNQRETARDPLAHAEMIAIREAAWNLGGWRLIGTTVYVTMEPCFMCAGALVQSRVERLVYGVADPKGGAVESLVNLVQFPGTNHQIEVTGGVCAAECRELVQQFFQRLRREKGHPGYKGSGEG
ncbi:MAG: tRNA adenosine(34) deaminase TadA [Syntrophomonadaceae bacterium]|nr:tRNA adenosine(34) deaminase TadA [Syntrophomonadaceae bacterium]